MAKRFVFRDTWKDYLSFSKRERRGIFALLLIIIFQLIILGYLTYFPSRSPDEDFAQFEKEVDAFYAAASVQSNSTDQPEKDPDSSFTKDFTKTQAPEKIELFAFNPNNLSPGDWQRLGFREKQIRTIKNYESKGGKFYSKEDVKKMYCISEKEYERIEPYIDIPPRETESEKLPKKKFEKAPVLVDIGTADSSELLLLKGIGPAFARRISIYRNKLGGFIRKEQLKEVWGFSDSLYESLVPNISLKDTLNIRQINLNAADFNELRMHPYIGYQVANLVCNYRKQHNGFKTLDEIRKLPLVNEQLYSKLAPYLKIE